MTALEEKRKLFQKQFEEFMKRDHHDDWGPEDDAILRHIAIVYIEFQSGISGEPVLEEIMKIAKTLGAGLWSRFGDYLKDME